MKQASYDVHFIYYLRREHEQSKAVLMYNLLICENFLFSVLCRYHFSWNFETSNDKKKPRISCASNIIDDPRIIRNYSHIKLKFEAALLVELVFKLNFLLTTP